MKGFIELRAIGGHKAFFPIERIAFGNSNIGTLVFFNSSTYGVEETAEEIAAKIEEATSELTDDVLLAEICSVREKLKIATEIIKSYEPDFDAHQLGAADYDQCCEDLSTPEVIRQNIYYRTSDRLPTAADVGGVGEVFVSFDGTIWMTEYAGDANQYEFWAPCPKVEVRG